MKKFIEIEHCSFVNIKTGRNFTTSARQIKFIKNELSKRKLVRSLIAQSYTVSTAKRLASRIKEADLNDLSGSRSRRRIKLFITDLTDLFD